MMTEDLCQRCGKCCYYGRKNDKPCKYLSFWAGTWTCSIYERRLGAIMGKEHNVVYYCGRRAIDEKRIIEGCPYNEQIIGSIEADSTQLK